MATSALNVPQSADTKPVESDAIRLAKAQMQQKNMLVGLLLTFFFGGFGVFYCTTIGGIICTILEVILWLVAIFTFGFGAPLILVGHFIFVIVTAVYINSRNKKVLKSL